MVDIYETLQRSLSDLFSSSQQFKGIITKFHEDKQDLSALWSSLNSQDPYQLLFMKIYHIALFHSQTRLDLESSKTLAQWIEWSWANYQYQVSKEIIQEIDMLFISGLRNVVDSIVDMSLFETVFEIVSHMKNAAGNFRSYSDMISLKVIPWIWKDIITDLLEGTCKKSLIITAIKLVETGQGLGINNDDLNYVLIDRIFDYIKKKFDYYGLEGGNLDITEARELLACLSLIKIDDQELLAEFQRLKDHYGTGLLPAQSPYLNSINDTIETFTMFNPALQLDQRRLVPETQIHFYNKDPSFLVRVDKYKYNGEDIAIKSYCPKDKPLNSASIWNEIKILEFLSSKANEFNCFLKYIGTYSYQGSIYLAMEYHPMTLANKIDRIEKRLDQPFTINQLREIIYSMIWSFSLMEKLNIFHRDIKPSNFLYTANDKIKIIDFGGSEFKDTNDDSVYGSRLTHVSGTPAFMAPEVLEAHVAKQDKVKTMRGTSDVFSLGMTILQMIVLRRLDTLNMKENHSRLMDIVKNEIKEEWIKSLLFAMLRLNYSNRPRFDQCLSFIQSGDTKSFDPQ